MKKLKVVVYAICKNEEKFVDKWVDSMQEADLIIVTDTGSTDKTVEKLRKRNVIVFEEKIVPWRFDVARNISLEHVPKDTDVCVCTDLDEVFIPGWRNKIEKAWDKKTKMIKYIYNWSLKDDGTPDVQFHYFKIHSREDYVWNYPVHECLKYIGKEPELKKTVEDIILNHFPDRTKSRSSYLTLLEMGVKDDPFDDRMRYYLGREYMYEYRWQDSIDTLKAYLDLPRATWNEERCAAMRWIAKGYSKLNDMKNAYSWYFKAMAECSGMRDSFIEFAQLGYQLNDWPLVLFTCNEALKIEKKSTTYVNMGYAWNYTPFDLLAIATYNLGLFEKAYNYAKIAVDMEPSNERLVNNLIIIENKIKSKNS